MGGTERSLFQNDRLRHRWIARALNWKNRDGGGTRRAAAARSSAAAVRWDECDELLQREPRDAGAGRLSQGVVREERAVGPPKDRGLSLIHISEPTRLLSTSYA